MPPTASSDLPIALRRTRRSGVASANATDVTGFLSPSHSSTKDTTSPTLTSCISLAMANTPRKRGRPKTKKRVRFSDPGPIFEHGAANSLAPSTGLTPLVRRTSLAHSGSSNSAPAPQTSHRRHSTPARPFRGEDDGESEIITFLPLRQVIEGRVQRRIRRNHLSEEMNAVHAAKKRAEEARKAELERLKAEVREKDDEILRLTGGDETGSDRVTELEQQVQELRRQLDAQPATPGRDQSTFDWTMAARDPFNPDEYSSVLDGGHDDDAMDVNDDYFGETTMADLQCSTPSRHGDSGKKSTRCVGSGSFPTPPATSPTIMPMDMDVRMPMTPSSRFSTPRSTSHAGVQVAITDPEKEAMEQEMACLQLEIVKLTGTLEAYQTMTSRLKDKLAPFSDLEDVDELASSPRPDPPSALTSASTDSQLEANLDNLLSTLSTRTTSLLSITNTLSTLGFPGTDAPSILTSLSSALRTARLELEYLSPGESSLPLASSGAATLDLLLTRLRELSRAAKEADEQIDQYHEQELSLRKQLGARVDVMDGLGREVKKLEGEKGELEVSCERLRGAVERHAREVGELTALVGRMEEESGARGEVIKDMEMRLCAKERDVRRLKEQVAEMGRAHGTALRVKDMRVSELRGEVERVSGLLREAGETIRGLRVEGTKLEAKLEGEKERAREVVGGLREELERVVKASQEMLDATPRKKKTRASAVEVDAEADTADLSNPVNAKSGEYLSGGLARRSSGKGRKRRRYDSGLGFLDEEEDELEGPA